MNNIDIAEAIENGRPRVASEERTWKRWLRKFQDLWADYSFQIIVVFIAVILLIYTIVGKCNNRAVREAEYRHSWHRRKYC